MNRVLRSLVAAASVLVPVSTLAFAQMAPTGDHYAITNRKQIPRLRGSI
jgi:hypothetical protein